MYLCPVTVSYVFSNVVVKMVVEVVKEEEEEEEEDKGSIMRIY